jgi:hypothetical protein
LKEAADFGFAKLNVISLDGNVFERKYNHRQLMIFGRSNKKQWTFAASSKVFVAQFSLCLWHVRGILRDPGDGNVCGN